MNRALAVLAGQALDPPPIWMMRQAGRYLPEYRELRAHKGSFLGLATDPEAAAEVTLQPVRRFDFDVAILFSDILIVPWAMGQTLEFTAGEGPQLRPPMRDSQLAALTPDPSRYQPIWQTVARVRPQLSPDKALFGFAGAPFTVATYMVTGHGSRAQEDARYLAYADTGRFQALIDAISAQTIHYLDGQINAGADAVMLFDSWSGSLAAREFERWVIAPTAGLVAELRRLHPSVPIIGFPRGAGAKAAAYARETGVTALAVDESADLRQLLAALPPELPLQGNLDPMALKAGGQPMRQAIAELRALLRGRPHIFNLGHGIDRFTPIANVEAMVAAVRQAAG